MSSGGGSSGASPSTFWTSAGGSTRPSGRRLISPSALLLADDSAAVRAAVRGRQSAARWDKVSLRLALAEAALDWAITRQAYRLLGWKPSQARMQPIRPAGTPDDIMARLGAYMHAFRSMTACARAYADSFAKRHNIPTPRAITRAHTARRPLSSSNAQRWGRWIAASSRRDGGGWLHALWKRTLGPRSSRSRGSSPLEQIPNPFAAFWIPAFAGNTAEGIRHSLT